MTACATPVISRNDNADTSDSVQLQLAKHGFTPAVSELWRLDVSMMFGPTTNKPMLDPDGGDDVADVQLPAWLLPSAALDKSQWWPGDEHKLAALRSLLPHYQTPLLHSNVSGCPTRFYPFQGKNATTGAAIPPSTPFCQTFDGPTAAIAMVRMGLRPQATDAIDAFTRLASLGGSLSDEFNEHGEVQNKGTLVIAPAEYILAVWSYWSRWGGVDADADAALVRWLPEVERSAQWLISRADPITGWTYHSEDSFAPASAAVNGLTAAWRLCKELGAQQGLRSRGPSCTLTGAQSYLQGARRASILPQGLSSSNATQMRTAYAWFSPLKAAVARDEFTARWYTSIWPHFTGSGGSRNNDGGAFAAGETSELSRSVFFNLTEQRRLMHGMYGWAWVDSPTVGVGGFIDTEHRWIPQGFSDRALWSMAEPAIYLTTNFSEASLTVIQPHAVSPIRTRANQTVTAVVQERRGLGVKGVTIRYTVSGTGGASTHVGPFAMEAGGGGASGGGGGAKQQTGYTWRHAFPVRILTSPLHPSPPTAATTATERAEEDSTPRLPSARMVHYVIAVQAGDGSDAGQAEGSFTIV